MDTSPPLYFWAGVPQSILYDNTTLAVARILGDGRRQRTRVFSELQSHYLFDDRFGRPGKGNDKEFWINAKKTCVHLQGKIPTRRRPIFHGHREPGMVVLLLSGCR